MSNFPKLMPTETLLKGSWVASGEAVIADDVSQRIGYLIQNVLVQVATDDSGWILLYEDPEDNRYWELSYPNSDIHGGGAPELRQLSNEEAQRKYRELKG